MAVRERRALCAGSAAISTDNFAFAKIASGHLPVAVSCAAAYAAFPCV